jgi:hypothetical protein
VFKQDISEGTNYLIILEMTVLMLYVTNQAIKSKAGTWRAKYNSDM